MSVALFIITAICFLAAPLPTASVPPRVLAAWTVVMVALLAAMTIVTMAE